MTDITDPNPERPVPPTVPTDPAELLTLFGRFFSAIFLMCLTIALILTHNYVASGISGIVAVFTQRAAIQLYRRLRDERAAALAALESQSAIPPPEETRIHAS